MAMKMGWRWYGEGNDPVTLGDIRQIPGVSTIVWALHNKMPGEIWEVDEIRPVVEAAFSDVADLLTAIYLVANYVDQDAAKAAKVEAIIDKMNAEILRLIETLNRRGAGAKPEVPPTDPTTPTDPEPEPEPEPENPDVV